MSEINLHEPIYRNRFTVAGTALELYCYAPDSLLILSASARQKRTNCATKVEKETNIVTKCCFLSNIGCKIATKPYNLREIL